MRKHMSGKRKSQLVALSLILVAIGLSLNMSTSSAQTRIAINKVVNEQNAGNLDQRRDSPDLNIQLDGQLLTLQDAYALSLKNNEQILIARKEIIKSELLPKKANAIMLPKVNVYGQYRRYNEPISVEPEFSSFNITGEAAVDGFSVPVETEIGGISLPTATAKVDSFSFPVDVQVDGFVLDPIVTVPENQTGVNFEIVQPLYKGSWLPSREQAKHSITRDSESYQQVVQEILLQVAQVYYEAIKAKELTALSHEILKLAQEEKRVAQTKFEQGAVTEDAVLNADLKITATESKLIEYGNRFKFTQKVLKRYIGEEIGDFDVFKPADLPVESRSLDELIDIAIRNRHDLKRIRAMKAITKSKLEIAKSRFHPSLESSWNYFAYNNPSYYQADNYWILALQLSVPIYEGGLRYWEFEEKTETVMQAELALQNIIKNIGIEVQEVLLQVETIEGIIANLKKQVELAQKSYDVIFSKFKFGAASTVELNQAIAILNTVKTDLTVNTIDFQVALLRLQKVIGLLGQQIIPKG
ncbi:MAG: TolC family protein [Bacteroidales bacterium]|nr:TolC family protein [Bacteroidales bacterium]